MTKRFCLIALGAVAFPLLLSACDAPRDYRDGEFWQRKSPSEAIYQRGPKAQQMLQRDIARCTSELRELDRLDVIRDSFPADRVARAHDKDAVDSYPDPDGQSPKLEEFDYPDRDGYLLAENADYWDFEGCMMAKGWDRQMYVPYATVQKSQEDYVNAVEDARYRNKHQGRPKPSEEELRRMQQSAKVRAPEQGGYND
ncbi:MAG: hypothetical protein AB7E85_00040 [Pseudobdellovibrionaceae bacterium]